MKVFFKSFLLGIVLSFLSPSVLALHTGSIKVSLTKVAALSTLPFKKKRPSSIVFEGPTLFNNIVVFRTIEPNAIYANLYGSIQPIATSSIRAPGSDDRDFEIFNDTFATSSENLPAISTDNNIVFLALSDIGKPGIYLFSHKKLSVVADHTNTLPQTKNHFTSFSSPGFLKNNVAAFVGETKDSSGIYSINEKGKISSLANTQTPIPEGEGNFTSFSKAFFGRGKIHNFVFLGKGTDKQHGIYLYKNGKISKITSLFTKIPGGTGFFFHPRDLSFDPEKGQVAFIGKGIVGQSGIYFYDGKNILKIADKQTVMPDVIDKFNDFSGVSLDNGMIVFVASGLTKHLGVYLFADDKIFKIVSSEDIIDNKKIIGFDVTHRALDKNKLALVINFADKTSAVYIASLKYSAL